MELNMELKLESKMASANADQLKYSGSGKETIGGAHRRPKWVRLRLCSGSAQACSGSAQVKAAVAHVRRPKRNQRKGKLILSLWEYG